eukprot:2719541-Pyramimonas_sp.AAC.1
MGRQAVSAAKWQCEGSDRRPRGRRDHRRRRPRAHRAGPRRRVRAVLRADDAEGLREGSVHVAAGERAVNAGVYSRCRGK